MLRRRTLLFGFAAAAFATPATAAETDDPKVFLTDVYKRLAQTRKRNDLDFWQKPEGRAVGFTADLIKVWAAAEAKTADGDAGPIDFDLFTNAQDAPAATPTIVVVDNDGRISHVRATLRPPKPGAEPSADDVLVFTLKRATASAGWRIDDIHGSVSGDPWNLRSILTMQ